MKLNHLFFCVLLTISALTAKAEQLKFMDVPIGSDLSEFTTMLDSKGFAINTYVTPPDDATLIYNGEFAGQSRDVIISYDKDTNKATSVIVLLELNCDLATAKNTFEQYKKQLIDQYGYTCHTPEGLGDTVEDDNYYLVYIDQDTEASTAMINLDYEAVPGENGLYNVLLGYSVYNEDDIFDNIDPVIDEE